VRLTSGRARLKWHPIGVDMGAVTLLRASDEGDRPEPAAVLTVAAPSEDRRGTWLLRGGLAFVFLFAGSAMVLHPEAFAKYVPGLVPGAAVTVVLHLFAAFEVVLAAGLLSRRHVYAAAVVSALTLVTITLLNLDAFDVLFRNVAIACAAASLALQTRPAGRPHRG
jgi:uncharacterized membrane protein